MTKKPTMTCSKQRTEYTGFVLGTGVSPGDPKESVVLAMTCNHPSVVDISNNVCIALNTLSNVDAALCHTPRPWVFVTHSMIVGTDDGPDKA